MKRLLAVLLALSLFASCGTLFAFATSPDDITTTPEDMVQPGDDAAPCGQGYSQQKIYINNVEYTATFSLAGDVTKGGYSVFDTDACCIRYHYTVTVCFKTVGTGQETYSGGYRVHEGTEDNNYTGVEGATKSYYVTYRGTNTATAINSIRATGKIITVDQNGTTHSYNFSAGA